MINKQSYQIQGMRQDNLVGTGFSSKFAHEIMNMRLNTIGDYTTASWTSEKGTKELTIEFVGKKILDNGTTVSDLKPLGQASFNDIWVLFFTVPNLQTDYIITFKYIDDNTLAANILYRGNLNFDLNFPIETLTFYENENIQKVYWVDGKNQPRVINIANPKDIFDNIDTQFDFVQEVSLNEEVEVSKIQLGTGIFPPCSVKYAITYYQKYGAETNIVYTSPLYYPTLGDRACSPDEISGDSFKIRVDNVDKEHNFDFIRLYSIIRTSDGATPIVRIVEDKTVPQEDTYVEFIDTNTKGRIVDPSILQYIGGKNIIANTFNQKDNTLFLGNIHLEQRSLTSVLNEVELDVSGDIFTNAENKKLIPYKKAFNTIKYYGSHQGELIPAQNASLNISSFYSYHNEMNPAVLPTSNNTSFIYHGNSFDFKTFKTKEIYRFGLQAQDSKGVWSEVVYLKDEEFKENPILDENGSYYKAGYAKFTISTTVVNTLYDADYRRVRLVCCYPNIGERRVLAQGIINPTIYNEKERNDNTPYCMASWFFRTNKSELLGNIHINPIEKEIYSVSRKSGKNDSKYHIDYSTLTLNSPDIELDETIRTLDLINSSVSIIGAANLNKFAKAIYLDSGKPARNSIGVQNVGLTNAKQQGDIAIFDHHNILGFAVWNDCNVYYWRNGNSQLRYPIYPFHRNSSLNNYLKDISEWTIYPNPNNNLNNNDPRDTEDVTIEQTAKLNSKVMSYFTYSNNTNYEVLTDSINLRTSCLSWFDSNEVMPVLLKSNSTLDKMLVYYGNVNTIAPIETLPTDQDDLKNNYTSEYTEQDGNEKHKLITIGTYNLRYLNGDTENTSFNFGGNPNKYSELYSSDPVPITYKSTPHLVFNSISLEYKNLFEDDHPQYLYIGELVRNSIDRNPISYTDIYSPCGPSVRLEEGQPCTIYGLEGDSYLMRYDCLKTYPYTTEDVNQIVEIASIMCETRINLDGRYDRNRGLTDNTTVLPTNFNLINKSYTQSNNFFSYTTLDENDATLDDFDNQFTWTKEKVSGEEIDAWTNITLASTADADGTLGSITKISNLNNNLLLFQDHGLAQIGYNENTAISTENGVPLELAKTGKYTGLNYISREIGCQNKWSISQSKNGIFWIDDSRQEMLRYGEGIQSLSSLSGFDAFMIKELPSPFKAWNPDTFDNFVTYYDKLSNDIYYINKNNCLAWNELSQTFTSFYNYEEVPYMVNIGQHSLMWKDKVYAAREGNGYNTFFGNLKDYWMTLVCDGQTDKGSAFPADKVFNNIEYRADVYNIDGNNTNYATSVFNKQHVWNGYQDSHECNLDGIRKFNTWRVQLPRHYGTRDRIRNPFCYIKLKQDQSMNTQTDRMILHDLAVYFDMK